MFLPATYALAVLFTIITMICWGSWANTYKAAGNYRFELYYWDYIFGVVFLSVVLAMSIGSVGSSGEPFLHNLRSSDAAHWVYALAGGFIFNVANLLQVAGIALTGLAIAVPICVGIAIVEGVALSYLIQPIGNPLLLGAGVVLAIGAVIFDAVAYRSLIGNSVKTPRKGIVINVVAGVLMGIFAPFVTKAMTGARPLTPYSVIVLFSLGAFLSCLVVNVYFMRRPLDGEPVEFSQFFKAGFRNHSLGLLGGAVWGLGTAFNFIAAKVAGVAISFAIGEMCPVVAALWGVLAWREFADASRRAWVALILMFLLYIAAVALIAEAHIV